MTRSCVRRKHRLSVRWDKRELGGRGDAVADLSPRFGNATICYILTQVFTPEVMRELKDRGFDLNTMRFHIDRTPEKIAEVEAIREKAKS